jgi:hypothetical protein
MDLILSHPTSQGSAFVAEPKPSGQYVCFNDMAKMGLSLSQILKRLKVFKSTHALKLPLGFL